MGYLKPSNFQLIGKPRVTKKNFQLNKEFDFPEEVSLEIDNNIKVVKTSEEDMIATVILNLKFFNASDLTEVPFKLEIEIEGMFQWGETVEEDTADLETLLYQNAPAILYSYLRPIITSASIEANLPPLVIPLMNFSEE